MAIKVNLKKYLKCGGRWQFVPVLKVKGLPKPAYVVIRGEAVKEPSGEFYLEWRSDGKRRQVPCGSDPRGALDAWRSKKGILNGTIDDFEPEEIEIPVSKRSIRSAFDQLLVETDATKRASTYLAYQNDLRWFQESIERRNVAQVTRDDIIHLLSIGREEGLAQATINRRVQTGLRALRNAGSTILMKKGDWPRIAGVPVEIYSPEELSAFFEACNPEEWVIFQVFLQSGFRKREVSTLRWQDIDFQNNALGVVERLEYRFQPKSYEARNVRVPAALMNKLKVRKKSSKSPLVFPTSPHPLRPDYGGDAPDEHHLELCKEIAYRAGLNCGFCVLEDSEPDREESSTRARKRLATVRKCSDGPWCEHWFLHKWRHTYATNMLRSGVDITTMQELLGHKNLSTTQRYLKALRLDELVAHTAELSSRLRFQLNDLGYDFPRYPVSEGETMDSFLRKRVEEGVLRRYGPKRDARLLASARKQVDHELALIAKLGFAGYFLIVWDIIQYCKQHDILVQGRGSAANSAVCYALEITAIDPVGMELLFERFLNEDRGEWPDIDLDLPSEEKREQAIQYVYQRYGELGAAMTANVITYRGKSAAREVGKALGFDAESLRRLSGLVSHFEWRGPADTMAHSFQNAGFDLHHPRIAKYLELCMRIQDLPRHLGQHSGGMVICQGQLNCVVPIERASMPGRTVIQWDKEDCADMGLVKVDLLGLGMMAVLKDCLELVPQHYGEPVDLAHLPQDEEVYRTLQRTDTVGIFQVESRAQMASLPHNRPKKFYDLVVQVAIIRPGPIVGKMMHPYMRRRQGKEAVTYPHPSLEPVLRRTLGVPLFQEQLLRIAMTVANFSGAEAEELRRAVGMRRSWERMKNLESNLRAGMTANGIEPATQEEIIQQISSFALYGFPESHAASFALIAYASAYFKVKYLAAFTCAILNNQPMGFYMPAVLVKDAQRHGLRVKPIDVQHSTWPCTLEHESDENLSLRLGLGYAKGLRRQSAEALVLARKHAGSFRSVEDVVARVPALNRKELTLLAQTGALNSIDGIAHRRDALWQIERAGKPKGPLLQNNREVQREQSACLPLKIMNTEERLVADYAGTGLTIGKHPMAYRRKALQRENILTAQELHTHRHGEYVRTAGCVIARQRPGTAKGFVFISMEDETGIANVIVTPDLFERERLTVTRSKFLLAEGPLQNVDGVIHVKATHLRSLSSQMLAVRSHDFH